MLDCNPDTFRQIVLSSAIAICLVLFTAGIILKDLSAAVAYRIRYGRDTTHDHRAND